MNRHLLDCRCGHRIPVTPCQAGNTIRCPDCGAELPVPRLGALRRLEPAAAERPAGGSEASRPWTTAHACLLAGLVVATVAGMAAMMVQATRTAVIDEGSIRAAVRAGEIGQIYQAWQTFARQGVERAVMPDEEQLLRQARLARTMGGMLWAVAAGGLALAAAGWVALVRRTAHRDSIAA
jgi:hypothetical protein